MQQTTAEERVTKSIKDGGKPVEDRKDEIRKAEIRRQEYRFPRREQRTERVRHELRHKPVSWRSVGEGWVTEETEIVFLTCMKTSEDCPPWTHHFPSMMVKGTPVTFDLAFSHMLLISSTSSSEFKKSMVYPLVSMNALYKRKAHHTSCFDIIPFCSQISDRTTGSATSLPSSK